MLSHDACMGQMSLSSFVKGKVSVVVAVGDTRGLAVQACLLELVSRIVINKVQDSLDVWSEREGVAGFVLGCGKGSQSRDVSWNLSQALEKGRDRIDKASVASADIEKCHECLPWGTSFQGFLRRGIPLLDVSAIFRILRCPVLQLKVGSCITRPLERTRRALTGNPLASSIAHIFVEDSLSLARHDFRGVFELPDSVLLDSQS